MDDTAERDGGLYDRLLGDIAMGLFAGGQRLKINELAERYGTSSNPIREVLRQLQGEGFVEITQNRGATVRKTDTDSVRDVYEMLQLLEPYFVGWFAEVASAPQVDQLEEIQLKIEAMPVNPNDRFDFTELDSQFHDLIHSHHYNQRAIRLWRNLRRSLQVLTVKLPVSPRRRQAVNSEHRELIAAFSDNDSVRAREAILKHIAGAGDQVYKQLRAREAKPAAPSP